VTQLLPESVVESTLTAATRFASAQAVSTSVQSLTHGVLKAMLLNKLKTVSLVFLVIGGVSGSALAWARRTAESPIQTVQTKITPGAQPPAGAAAPAAAPFPERAAMKNTPTLADFRDPIPIFGTGSILVVDSKDGNSLEARSVDSEDVAWQKLPIAPGLRVTPIASEDTLALKYDGESIKELAAFSAYTGEWSTVQLAEPVHETISPAIGGSSALYQAGNDFYAFSSQKGAWDVLRLPAGASPQEKPRSSLAPKYISVQQGDRIWVFSLKHGKWSQGATLRLPAAKKPAADANPLLKP
jgi:hypothetical protein